MSSHISTDATVYAVGEQLGPCSQPRRRREETRGKTKKVGAAQVEREQERPGGAYRKGNAIALQKVLQRRTDNRGWNVSCLSGTVCLCCFLWHLGQCVVCVRAVLFSVLLVQLTSYWNENKQNRYTNCPVLGDRIEIEDLHICLLLNDGVAKQMETEIIQAKKKQSKRESKRLKREAKKKKQEEELKGTLP